MPNRGFQNSYKLGSIIELREMHTDSPRLPWHVTSRIMYLIIISILVCIGQRHERNPFSVPNLSIEYNTIRIGLGTWSVFFLQSIYVNLNLPMDQRKSMVVR